MLPFIAKIIEYLVIATVFMAVVCGVANLVFQTAKWVAFHLPVVRPILISLSEKYKARKARKEKEDREWAAYVRSNQQLNIQTNNITKTEDVIAAAVCLKIMSSNRPAGSATGFDRSFPFFK